jgi:hypothetical protein
MKSEAFGQGRFMRGKGALRLCIALFVVVALLVCAAPRAFADTNGSATVNVASKVTLTVSQTAFTVPVSIAYDKAFAGVELAIQCGSGVTVESVRYNRTGSHAGPTLARGLVWFGAFSGENDFPGELTASILVNYSGTENTSIVVDHVSFHRLDGGAFRTENAPLRKTIAIDRAGADNTPPPLDPPDPGAAPGTGNPPSGALAGGGVSVTSVGSSASASRAASDRGASGERGDRNGQNDRDEQISTGDVEYNGDSIPSSEVPRAGGNTTTPIPIEDATGLNMALLVTAIICLTAFLTLGFLWIKKRREEQKEKEEMKEVL